MIDYALLGVGIILWLSLFKLIQWKWGLTTASTSYTVAFIHGLYAARSCEYIIVTERLWDVNRFGDVVSPLQGYVLTFSLAYFIYDTMICFTMKESLMMKAHHILAVIIFFGTILGGTSGPEVTISLWYGEFTNAFFNLRYFFQNSERFNGSTIAFINDACFFVFFLFLRFFFGTYVIYHILTLGRSLLVVQVGAVLFTFVNFMMGKLVIEGAMKVIFPPSNNQTEKQK